MPPAGAGTAQLPALPSLASNPLFSPSTPADPTSPPSAPNQTSNLYYPPPPTSTYRPAVASPPARILSPASTRDGALIQPSTSAAGNHGLSVSQSQTSQAATEWELAFERQQEERWGEKIRTDLAGWRGGHGVVRSSYSRTAVPGLSYFGQSKTGVLGLHFPKEVVRIERDWSDGEVCQFESSFPMELEGRVRPDAFQALIEAINIHLAAAYSIRGATIDNLIAIASWWTSLWWRTSCFERNLIEAEGEIRRVNEAVFNPAGLNVLSPRDVALQYLEIEYY